MSDTVAFDISKAERDRLIALVVRYGATVTEDWNEPFGARFIGTFSGRHITLFPKFDSHFAMYFTVAHLYGHMVQHLTQSAATRAAEGIIGQEGVPFTAQQIQRIYDHEYEAACIGRRLIAELGPVPRELDGQYHRFFLADFHYLVHYLETGEGGPDVFARFFRREPVPALAVPVDSRAPIDLSGLEATAEITVV